jgi:hypothetical protein
MLEVSNFEIDEAVEASSFLSVFKEGWASIKRYRERDRAKR